MSERQALCVHSSKEVPGVQLSGFFLYHGPLQFKHRTFADLEAQHSIAYLHQGFRYGERTVCEGGHSTLTAGRHNDRGWGSWCFDLALGIGEDADPTISPREKGNIPSSPVPSNQGCSNSSPPPSAVPAGLHHQYEAARACHSTRPRVSAACWRGIFAFSPEKGECVLTTGIQAMPGTRRAIPCLHL